MNCQKCGSERMMHVNGKCNDLFNAEYADHEYQGYVLRDIGIGGGDYIRMSYCLECGQIDGDFPIKPNIRKGWKSLD